MLEDKLIELLNSFGYPVRRQGSLIESEEYPNYFFTFWNNDSYDRSHYSNDASGVVYDFDVNFYSINPNMTYSILDEARILLKENGAIITGRGYDVASDEITHTGRGMRVLFIK